MQYGFNYNRDIKPLCRNWLFNTCALRHSFFTQGKRQITYLISGSPGLLGALLLYMFKSPDRWRILSINALSASSTITCLKRLESGLDLWAAEFVFSFTLSSESMTSMNGHWRLQEIFCLSLISNMVTISIFKSKTVWVFQMYHLTYRPSFVPLL